MAQQIYARSVHVFELMQPGTWLDLPGNDPYADPQDQAVAHQTGSLLRAMTQTVCEIGVALNLYEESKAQFWDRLQVDKAARKARHDDRSSEHELRARVMAMLVAEDLDFVPHSAASDHVIWERVEIERKREQWAAGVPPRDYLSEREFLAARAFVYALDQLQRMLRSLAKLPSAPAAVAPLAGELKKAVPDLKRLRDSAHHFDERVQGLARGEPIKFQTQYVSLGNIHQGGLDYTGEDGRPAHVKIDEATARLAQSLVQRALDAYAWRGSKQHSPAV